MTGHEADPADSGAQRVEEGDPPDANPGGEAGDPGGSHDDHDERAVRERDVRDEVAALRARCDDLAAAVETLADTQGDLATAMKTLTEYVEAHTDAAHAPEAAPDDEADAGAGDEPEDATRAFY